MPSAASPPVRNGRPHGAPIFFLALVLGVGAHVGVLSLVHFSVELPPAKVSPPPTVQYIQSADPAQAEVMRDEAIFSDPRVLYAIPPANFATATPPSLSGAKPALNPFPLDLATKLEGEMKDHAQPNSPAVAPVDVLNSPASGVLRTMGKTSQTGPALAPRGAQLRIARLQGAVGSTSAAGGATQDVTWPADQAPDAGIAIWSPAVFTLSVNAAGAISSLQLKTSSGVARVDADLGAKLKSWLAQNPQKSGFYQIEIGP